MKIRPRIIPVLLLDGNKILNSEKFSKYTYIGDPINIIKIFNDKEVDEICILNINKNKNINYDLLSKISEEAFMPISYGGGIKNFNHIDNIIKLGFEKVVLNSILFENPLFLNKAVSKFGSSTIIVSIDIKKNFFGNNHIYINNGTKKINKNYKELVKKIIKDDPGEIMITSINNDGMYNGYNLNLLKEIRDLIKNKSIVINGGARNNEDFKIAYKYGANAFAASSIFVYFGNLKGILINYPNYNIISGDDFI